MFVVPVIAALQQPGQQSIDSRSVQWHSKVFFQNLAMLWVVGSYTFAAAHKIDPVLAMLMPGILIFGAIFLVSLYLPDNKEK